MSIIDQIKKELSEYIDNEKAAFLPRFFRAFEGGYGEGDRFIGVSVPNQRKVAKRYFNSIDIKDIERLLNEPVHEYRLTALFMLVYKFEKAKDEREREEIVNTYLRNIKAVNNWDLVDSSAPKILGPYLFNKDKSILYDMARTPDLWKQRIAIMSTFYFIKQGEFDDALNVARILLNHEHDLVHKAVGWMLREIGNRNFDVEYEFLKENYKVMPRTMLRYAIEKFEPELRQQFLEGLI
ncbi:DNA alkylation repair protein [Thermosediminibacter oceani]|uniref:DNA alkylation repair enzyme n=1 Tax=Thermosediminibacter oceani (strain ATCC BAA-1034 / DSM 16646 / JW/IW-1228P) TaxID=555079 RepID=D9S2M7_THEOJ|nr:DNA alkylation repair protein [Thermosediminibacter oceani]ADL07654.1 DNA alkylation repair enzyme [Thermosediminibacter oceani DSM 16646]